MITGAPAVSFGADPAEFFRAHYPKLYAYFSAATGAAKADVEDLVQETLLQAWRDRRNVREESATGWVTAIARHRVADYRRGRRRDENGGRVLRALGRLESERLPDDLLADAELGRSVRAALQKLPPETSRLLLRRYLDGRTVRELARESKEGEDAVESRLRRAHEALRRLLSESAEHE